MVFSCLRSKRKCHQSTYTRGAPVFFSKFRGYYGFFKISVISGLRGQILAVKTIDEYGIILAKTQLN